MRRGCHEMRRDGGNGSDRFFLLQLFNQDEE